MGVLLLYRGVVKTDRYYGMTLTSPEIRLIGLDEAKDTKNSGVADLRYERLNMHIIETSIHNASGFSTDFFHTLIKQRRKLERVRARNTEQFIFQGRLTPW
ncbi:hypothetical protein [Microcoleus sp.]|uniref:hypothetical protein n=1 Tax=Microcoleus sp. TaxID=44472 RepID=UPI0035267838